jgi:uncharacterized protein YbaR (Trm112 family)/ubiquinone/menaquinone biosynthesis C-methylase UbiE
MPYQQNELMHELLPVDHPYKKNSLMLEIGSTHGEWLIAGAKKKYIPIGIAVNLDNAKNAMIQLRQHKSPGYVIVGEISGLSFQDNIFDLAWSANVFRPANLQELTTFSEQLHRIMAKSGKLKLPFQQKRLNGSANQHIVSLNGKPKANDELDQTSIREYEQIFRNHFPNASSKVHGCFGVTAYKENFIRARASRKPKVGSVLMIEYISRVFPALKRLSDSLFITGQKIAGPQNIRISHFLRHHWLRQNLNVVYLLQCPISGGPVYLSKDAQFVISDKANVKYPVINEIPIMLKKAAIQLERKSISEAEFK